LEITAMYRHLLAAVTGVVMLALLAGCGKSEQRVPRTAEAVVGDNTIAAQAAGAQGKGAAEAGAGGSESQGGGASAPAGVSRLIYFDYDSSEIRPEFVSVIAAHAHALARNASVRVRLEGHTDERGSPEYNIGLGERRAQAVRRALMLQGVTDAQVATVSYGQERPAVSGHDEAAWAKNRRVEFIYLN
jgi:peptidoglycan-associated lipoprotein